MDPLIDGYEISSGPSANKNLQSKQGDPTKDGTKFGNKLKTISKIDNLHFEHSRLENETIGRQFRSLLFGH